MDRREEEKKEAKPVSGLKVEEEEGDQEDIKRIKVEEEYVRGKALLKGGHPLRAVYAFSRALLAVPAHREWIVRLRKDRCVAWLRAGEWHLAYDDIRAVLPTVLEEATHDELELFYSICMEGRCWEEAMSACRAGGRKSISDPVLQEKWKRHYKKWCEESVQEPAVAAVVDRVDAYRHSSSSSPSTIRPLSSKEVVFSPQDYFLSGARFLARDLFPTRTWMSLPCVVPVLQTRTPCSPNKESWVEIREDPSTGWGLYAVRVIPKDTLVLVEDPWLACLLESGRCAACLKPVTVSPLPCRCASACPSVLCSSTCREKTESFHRLTASHRTKWIALQDQIRKGKTATAIHPLLVAEYMAQLMSRHETWLTHSDPILNHLLESVRAPDRTRTTKEGKEEVDEERVGPAIRMETAYVWKETLTDLFPFVPGEPTASREETKEEKKKTDGWVNEATFDLHFVDTMLLFFSRYAMMWRTATTSESKTSAHAPLIQTAVDIQAEDTDPSSSSSNSIQGAMVYRFSSLLNHACRANSDRTIHSTRGFELHITTNRTVQAGEQVCISYIPFQRSYKARQAALERFGFKCECEVCDHQRRRILVKKGFEFYRQRHSPSSRPS